MLHHKCAREIVNTVVKQHPVNRRLRVKQFCPEVQVPFLCACETLDDSQTLRKSQFLYPEKKITVDSTCEH